MKLIAYIAISVALLLPKIGATEIDNTRIKSGVELIKLGCGTGASSSDLQVKGAGSGSLTLGKGSGANASAQITYSQEEAQGLLAALTKEINSGTLALSEKQMDCMKPYVDRIFETIFPKNVPSSLDQKTIQELSSAEADCLEAKFASAQAVLRRLTTNFPGEETIQKVSDKCKEIAETPKEFDVLFEVAPAVYMYDEGDNAYLASFDLEIENNYCGSLSNLNGQDSETCNEFPGLRNFKLKSISLYSTDKANLFMGGSCGGSFIFKPNSDKYAIVMCLKKPYISCAMQPVDENFYNFTHENCKFKL